MELIGKLKEQVQGAKDQAEARSIIEQAGIILTDDELDQVTGGTNRPPHREMMADTPIITPWI